MSRPRHVELAELAGVDVQEVETATGVPDWGGYFPGDQYMHAIPNWWSERLETRWLPLAGERDWYFFISLAVVLAGLTVGSAAVGWFARGEWERQRERDREE